MDEREADKAAPGRARRVLEDLVPVPVFVGTMLVTLTVFTLQTVKGWQALAAGWEEGVNFYWRLYQAATHDNLEGTLGAVFLSLVGGNFVRFIWEAIMLFYDRVAKFDQLRAEAAAAAVAKVEAAAAEAVAKVETAAAEAAAAAAAAAAKSEAAAIAEQDRKWRGWIARRDAAAKQGLPFNEPPPAPLDD